MNDRQLRHVIDGIGGKAQGVPREDGFDITVASEVMAILCLSTSINDLKERLGEIVVGYSYAGEPVRARDLKAQGAWRPCSRMRSSPIWCRRSRVRPRCPRRSLRQYCPRLQLHHGHAYGDALWRCRHYRGRFGADLGAEKFLDIKCRMTGVAPAPSWSSRPLVR